jgi:hypothetical protein
MSLVRTRQEERYGGDESDEDGIANRIQNEGI